MASTLQPLSQSERDPSLDILRGFAMAGVFFVFCLIDIGWPKDHVNGLADNIVWWPMAILLKNRMYTMLLVTFGIGFYFMADNAKRKNEPIAPAFLRRLLGLVIIGSIHAVFLSSRDFIVFYGIAGLALLPAVYLKKRPLLIYFFFAFLLSITPAVRLLLRGNWPNWNLEWSNNYLDYLRYNWWFFKGYHQSYYLYFSMLFHFLLGFYIYKVGLFQRLKTDKRFRKQIIIITLLGSVVFWFLNEYWINPVVWPYFFKLNETQKFFIWSGIQFVETISMLLNVFFYFAILMAISSTVKGQKVLKPLAAFGQMAISNYIIQSIILVPYALMFNKFQNTPPFKGFILFIIFFPFQLWFSVWWLKGYKFGPFEWLLRSFTYWNWQTIKKKETTSLS